MTQTYIDTIPMLPFGMLNAFLITKGRRAILIDTGLPNSAHRVEKALRARGLAWSDLALTILTHAHIDHAGSALEITKRSQAPLMIHEGDLPYLQGTPPLLRATGPFGRLFEKTGAIERPFAAPPPDLVVTGESHDLRPFGFPAKLLHTPGHTPGSVSVLLDDGSVIAGDLAASGILLGGIAWRQRPKSPPFEEDPHRVAASLEHLLGLGGKRFYLGHGGPLPDAAIAAHARSLRAAAAA